MARKRQRHRRPDDERRHRRAPAAPASPRAAIKTTPRARRRRSPHRALNVTNLNVLFDATLPERTLVASPPAANNRSSYFEAHRINLNPYVNHNELHVPKELNVSELSTNLYNLKQTSTPIVQQTPHGRHAIGNYLKNSPVDGRNVARGGGRSEKVVKHNKLADINRTNVSRVSRISSVRCVGVVGSADSIETIFSRLRRYSRTSIRWSSKFVEFCNYIGISLKQTFSGLGTFQRNSCKCPEYQTEISNLTNRVEALQHELLHVKIQLSYHVQSDNKIETITNELLSLRQDFSTITDIKTQLNEIHSKIVTDGVRPSCNSVGMAVRGGAPPPPPPPPPPPLPLSILKPLNSFKITKKESSSCNLSGNKENSRPIISLDDILNVKLKKTGERATLPRRSIQEHKRATEVKLKPASTKQPILSVDSLSTSPCSSLTRLLNDNSTNPVGKLKRLKRIGGYSFDEISRRNQMVKRDRINN